MYNKLNQNTLVLATHNPAKIKEFTGILAQYNIKVLTLDTRSSAPEETGTSFAENALIKARVAALIMNQVALADDSGLVIPALGGRPGIHSRRWAEECGGFSKAFTQIELLLSPKNNIEAYFECALALSWPEGENAVFIGRVEGTLCFPPRGDQGFGYDPIFQPEGHNQTFAEMAPSQKQKISHRAKALNQLIKAYCL